MRGGHTVTGKSTFTRMLRFRDRELGNGAFTVNDWSTIDNQAEWRNAP